MLSKLLFVVTDLNEMVSWLVSEIPQRSCCDKHLKCRFLWQPLFVKTAVGLKQLFVDWFQDLRLFEEFESISNAGWDQLPASHCGAWRGPLKSPEVIGEF